MGLEFFQTVMGHKFYRADVPQIAESLDRIATALEKLVEVEEFKKGKLVLVRKEPE